MEKNLFKKRPSEGIIIYWKKRSTSMTLRGWMRIYLRYFPVLLVFKMLCRTLISIEFCIFYCMKQFFSFYCKYGYQYLCIFFSVNSQENLFAFPEQTRTKKFRGSEAANLSLPISTELEICLYWTDWFKHSWFKNI